MNKRLKETVERIRGGQDVLYIDAYNGRWDAEVFGTILTGIDYRCMHFIYEAQDDNKSVGTGNVRSDDKQQG